MNQIQKPNRVNPRKVKQSALFKQPKQCPVDGCDKLFTKRCDFSYHRKKYHPQFNYKQYQEQFRQHICLVCKVSYKNAYQLKQHIKKHMNIQEGTNENQQQSSLFIYDTQSEVESISPEKDIGSQDSMKQKEFIINTFVSNSKENEQNDQAVLSYLSLSKKRIRTSKPDQIISRLAESTSSKGVSELQWVHHLESNDQEFFSTDNLDATLNGSMITNSIDVAPSIIQIQQHKVITSKDQVIQTNETPSMIMETNLQNCASRQESLRDFPKRKYLAMMEAVQIIHAEQDGASFIFANSTLQKILSKRCPYDELSTIENIQELIKEISMHTNWYKCLRTECGKDILKIMSVRSIFELRDTLFDCCNSNPPTSYLINPRPLWEFFTLESDSD